MLNPVVRRKPNRLRSPRVQFAHRLNRDARRDEIVRHRLLVAHDRGPRRRPPAPQSYPPTPTQTHAIQSASQSQRDLLQPPARATRTRRRLPAAQALRTKHSLADQSPIPKLTTPREPPTGANAPDEFAQTNIQSPEPREVRSRAARRQVRSGTWARCAPSHAANWQALKSLRWIRQGDERHNSRREVAATKIGPRFARSSQAARAFPTVRRRPRFVPARSRSELAVEMVYRHLSDRIHSASRLIVTSSAIGRFPRTRGPRSRERNRYASPPVGLRSLTQTWRALAPTFPRVGVRVTF